jgi:hypothetical protein
VVLVAALALATEAAFVGLQRLTTSPGLRQAGDAASSPARPIAPTAA